MESPQVSVKPPSAKLSMAGGTASSCSLSTRRRIDDGELRGLRIAIIRQGNRADGGGERIVDRMRGILTTQGHSVTLISRAVRTDGSNVLVCDPPAKGRVRRERAFAASALSLVNQGAFDVVQSHERIPGCAVYRAGDGVHATWLEQRRRVMDSFSRFVLAFQPYHRYVQKAERHLFEHPDLRAVICNSRMVMRDILNRFRIAADKLHLIYNGVDTTQFHPDLKRHRHEVRAELGISHVTPAFLFVGSGWERKGLATAIQAVSTHSAAHLIVVGRDKTQRRYEQLARRCRVRDRIHFVGVQQDVGRHLGATDAFILPALYDPFPNAVLEAMASSLPVITSGTCGAAEIITHGKQGFVYDALDVAGFADAITKLSTLTHAAEMGEQARNVVESMTVARMERELSQLYQQLLSRSRS